MTMTRDDAIKAVQVAALKKWAPRMDGLTTWEAGVVVDAVDPIIRADERHHSPYSRTAAGVRRDAEAKIADLRAKVEALPTMGSGWSDASVVVLRSDVLALLGEVSE